jgi:hypothetical protein
LCSLAYEFIGDAEWPDNSLSGYEASNKRSALVVLAANQKPIFDKPPV